jgi:hypothetical protein
MENLKFEQQSMPEVQQCETFEDLQKLADQWGAEGFTLDRNMPNGELQPTIDFYRRDQEITDIRLSTAFTNGSRENNWQGQKLADHTAIWLKIEKRQ